MSSSQDMLNCLIDTVSIIFHSTRGRSCDPGSVNEADFGTG